MKRAVWRYVWLLLFLAQIGFFYVSYSHTAAQIAHQHPIEGALATVLELDVGGVLCWGMALQLTEEISKQQSKGIRRLTIGAIVLVVILSLGVIGVNIRAWL